MPARDSNNATWFWLGYPRDFETQPAGPYDPLLPLATPSLFYDDARGVLELLPAPLLEEASPPPSLAVDVNGEIYRGEAFEGRTEITVERCDGSRKALVCDPFVFAGPRGLALDRRGYLYVADARANRVAAVLPDDGSVQGVLVHPEMKEPVDVAASPSGLVYVADRGGLDAASRPAPGRVFVFSSGFQFLRDFRPVNAEGLPRVPRPIAIMIEPDASIAVADANHPRLLHFSASGEPMSDLPAPVEEPLSPQVLRALYGDHAPRFLAGACQPPRPSHDGGEALAAAHRGLRRHGLSLGRSFELEGQLITAGMDSGTPETPWHRIELHARIPAGTSVTIETATGDEASGFNPFAADWQSARDDSGAPIPFTGEGADLLSPLDNQLVFSAPGRFLWLRITLKSDGRATPSVRAIRVLHPRVSYLDMLPRVYRRDPESARFLEHFLALFEGLFTRVEDRYEEFSRQLNPDGAPLEVINWLACLVDLSFDPSWPLEKRRQLVAAAMELYRLRGTPEGIRRFVEIYTGSRPEIVELYLQRPGRAPALGRAGSVVGCSLPLIQTSAAQPPEETLFGNFAHRFCVLVYADDRCDAQTLQAVVNRIVAVNRPAHTQHFVRLVFPEVQLGLRSQVGMDFVLGGRESGRMKLGAAGSRKPQPGGTLGLDSMLGEQRPYVRPREFQI